MTLQQIVNLIPWWLRDNIRHIPFLKQLQQWIFNRFLSGRSFVYCINAGPAKGLLFPIHLPEDKLYWTGTWEKQISKALAAAIPSGGICYDIGCHRGFMAGIISLAGAQRVYCFEPNPKNIVHLERLVELNPKLALKILPLAVGETNGTAHFSDMPESSMGKLKDSPFQTEVEQQETFAVTIRTLDDLVKQGEIAPPSFIKLDVEGAEMMALKGASRIINDYKPTLIIEVHSLNLAKDCDAFLKELGYQTHIIETGKPLNPIEPFPLCHLYGVQE